MQMKTFSVAWLCFLCIRNTCSNVVGPVRSRMNSNNNHVHPLEKLDLRLQNNTESMRAFTDGRHSQAFTNMYESFLKTFDDKYPSPAQIMKKTGSSTPFTPIQLSNLHPKRCIVLDNHVAKEKYIENKFSPWLQLAKPQASTIATDLIFVTTNCLGLDSLGNNLGSYFENVACSYFTGLHYISAVPIWEPAENDLPSPFLSKLPYLIEHPSPVADAKLAKEKINEICRCPGSCHERPLALWTKSLFLIKPILAQAVKYQYNSFLDNPSSAVKNYTTVVPTDLTNVQADKKLPLIPDVAIHYRCGDNFVGHYGFLPFKAFKNILKEPYDSNKIQTIYVLADSKDRKTKHKRHLVQKCDEIFNSLYRYLHQAFPKASIVIRRGDNIYLDFIRLSYARYTICSVSTFCLWPAVLNGRKAYFPQTRLVVGGKTEIDLGFNWIKDHSVVLATAYENGPLARLINALTAE
jgi:hypothetical protein